MKLRVLFTGLFISCALGACSVPEMPGSIEEFGGSVLDLVGLGPAKSIFDAQESIVKAAKDMSREEEYYLGRAVAARILRDYPALKNPALQRYVNKVGLAVAAFSERPETFGGYHFIILDSEHINAMAAPGGFIFVSRGMLELMPDEDALAAVLAHEITHVVKQHGLNAISEANLNAALAQMGQLAGSLNCGEVMQQATTLFGGAVEDVTTSLLEKGYSREQEYEADAGAVEILNRSGYNTPSLLTMLEQVEQGFQSNKTGWFNTHPDTADRRAEVAELIVEKGIEANEEGRVLRASRFHTIMSSV